MSIISVSNLCFSYNGNDKVIDSVTFDIDEKEFTAIIGPNGGGKSTLLKLLLGVLKPQSGTIEIFGTSPDIAREQIGYVPQNTNINIEFPITVMDVVLMGNRKVHNPKGLRRMLPVLYTKAEKGCAYTSLQKVGMERFADKKIGSLSGGQRQRVMIARALCSHPKMLMLDEPTSSIDTQGQNQIYSLLKELNSDLTIVVVSHDLSVITDYANKAIYVNRSAYVHDLSNRTAIERPDDEHFCEIELMQMLETRRGKEAGNG